MKKLFLLVALFSVLLLSCEKENDFDVCSVMEDSNFIHYSLIYFDNNKDGKVSQAEAESESKVVLDVKFIKSLKGIEYFKNIITLNISYNELEVLDISNNTALVTLYCSWNDLKSLNVSNHTALTELYCEKNEITNLDVTDNTKLLKLHCRWNDLNNLDVSKNIALTELYCGYNKLTKLDISNNTNLNKIHCYDNSLTNLDVSKNVGLREILCNKNNLNSLYMKNCPWLKYLDCSDNNLSTEALNFLFESLPNTNKGSIHFYNNPGSATCDRSIYEAKGWKGVGELYEK